MNNKTKNLKEDPFASDWKLPPQAIDMEEAVIGAVLTESKSLDEISFLTPEDFYRLSNQIIFSAILTLKSAYRPIDLLTVKDELQKQNKLEEAGGILYLTELTSRIAGAAHAVYHATVVKEKATARKFISFASAMATMAFSEGTDIQDLIEFSEKTFTEISGVSSDAESYDMNTSILATLEHYSKVQSNRERGLNISVPTGLKRLDVALNGGFYPPDLIILGGRPGMGKTEFSIHFAKHAGLSGNDCLFISIEMTKVQLITRMLLENDKIDFFRLKTGQLNSQEWDFINQKANEISRFSINIADNHNVRYLNNIKSLARKKHREGKLKLLIIDYLQLIKTNMKFQTRDLEVGYITGELKNLAKELNIPIVLLAQLSRPQKGVKINPPKLEDLRESGNIEQDADIVIFIHRTAYYDPEAVDELTNESIANRGGLIIAKNREGVKDETVFFEHDDRFKKIWDYNSNLSSNPF